MCVKCRTQSQSHALDDVGPPPSPSPKASLIFAGVATPSPSRILEFGADPQVTPAECTIAHALTARTPRRGFATSVREDFTTTLQRTSASSVQVHPAPTPSRCLRKNDSSIPSFLGFRPSLVSVLPRFPSFRSFRPSFLPLHPPSRYIRPSFHHILAGSYCTGGSIVGQCRSFLPFLSFIPFFPPLPSSFLHIGPPSFIPLYNPSFLPSFM